MNLLWAMPPLFLNYILSCNLTHPKGNFGSQRLDCWIEFEELDQYSHGSKELNKDEAFSIVTPLKPS